MLEDLHDLVDGRLSLFVRQIDDGLIEVEAEGGSVAPGRPLTLSFGLSVEELLGRVEVDAEHRLVLSMQAARIRWPADYSASVFLQRPDVEPDLLEDDPTLIASFGFFCDLDDDGFCVLHHGDGPNLAFDITDALTEVGRDEEELTLTVFAVPQTEAAEADAGFEVVGAAIEHLLSRVELPER